MTHAPPSAPPPDAFEGSTARGVGPFALLLLVLALAAVGAFLFLARGSGQSAGTGESAVAPTARPAATPTPVAQGLRQQADQQQLPKVTAGLQELIRKQPWYQYMTPATFGLLAALVRCEQAARAHGEQRSVGEMLQLATEQGWYADGLEDHEATGLASVVDAYTRSFTKEWAPAIGPVLSTTLRFQLFRVVSMPESGDKVVVVASPDEKLGRRALDLASENLPRVEELVGKFPYPFLYFEVTRDLDDVVYGVSYDEFIGLATDGVDAETIIHEITHSTMYGLFPIWFEEGMAYFMEAYLTNQVEALVNKTRAEMRRVRVDERLDVRAVGYYTLGHEIQETSQGFLFVKALYDIQGIEGLSRIVKALRTRTYNDQELLAAIVQQTPDDKQTAVRKLYCDRVIGTLRSYCVPGATPALATRRWLNACNAGTLTR